MPRSASLALTTIFVTAAVAFTFAGTPRFAFVPNIDDGTVSEFAVDASTGQLLPNGYVTAGDHPRSFVQVGNFAYVANMNSSNISGYSLDESTGLLHELATSPFSAPGNPYALIAHPNGKFLYSVDALGSNVYVYAINGNGSLSQTQKVAADVARDSWQSPAREIFCTFPTYFRTM